MVLNCTDSLPDVGPARATKATTISLTRRVYETSGLIINPNRSMAWRPSESLIDGELDNRVPGKVTGWMRFFRRGKTPLRATFELAGDFHEDIQGKLIRLTNDPPPSDQSRHLDPDGTYMNGFSEMQRGVVGDITAGIPLGPWTEELSRRLMAQNELIWDRNGVYGDQREKRRKEFAKIHRKHIEEGDLFYCYSSYPYVEWYSEANGRAVLELGSSDVEIIDQGSQPPRQKTPEELVEDKARRQKAMDDFMRGMLEGLSDENRKNGGDGNVTGGVVG